MDIWSFVSAIPTSSCLIFLLIILSQCKREGFVQKVKDEEGEGCNVHGFLEVNKVAGNFHFIPGQSFHQSGFQFHDMLLFQQGNYNVRKVLFLFQSIFRSSYFK